MANEYVKLAAINFQGHWATAQEWSAAKPPSVGGALSHKPVVLGFPDKPGKSLEVRVDDAGNLYLGPAQ